MMSSAIPMPSAVSIALAAPGGAVGVQVARDKQP